MPKSKKINMLTRVELIDLVRYLTARVNTYDGWKAEDILRDVNAHSGVRLSGLPQLISIINDSRLDIRYKYRQDGATLSAKERAKTVELLVVDLYAIQRKLFHAVRIAMDSIDLINTDAAKIAPLLVEVDDLLSSHAGDIDDLMRG